MLLFQVKLSHLNYGVELVLTKEDSVHVEHTVAKEHIDLRLYKLDLLDYRFNWKLHRDIFNPIGVGETA